MKYHNKKVLALKFGEYFDIFQKIFMAGRNRWHWNIKLVTTTHNLKPYQAFISSENDMYVLPDLLKPQAWESDPTQVAKIKALISAAENKVCLPVSRIILSEERKIGRAYSKANYYWPNGIEARNSLKNNSFPNRILMRAFYFSKHVFEHYRPDFCLGCPTGGIINAVFHYVATYYEIPYVACMSSLVISNRHFWTIEWGSFNTNVDIEFNNLKQAGVLPSKASSDYIQNFRRAPEPMPHYKKMWDDKANQISLKNINKAIIDRFLYYAIPLLKGEKITNPKPFFQFFLNHYREYFLFRKQRKLYQTFTNKELSNFKYIYYPFHLDPEIVLNVQAPMWYNQLNTVKILSYNLPSEYKLIVREHRYNLGRRRTDYLNEVNSYPNTILVSAFDNQYKYIQNADLIVTVNGTTGLEGIMLQRPVITLDRTFYDAMNLAHSYKSKKDLGVLILDALNSPEIPSNYDDKVALFIDAERKITLEADAPPEEEMHSIQNILDQFRKTNHALAKDTTDIL